MSTKKASAFNETGPSLLSGDEIKAMLEELGWSMAELGRRTGHARNTVWRWTVSEPPLWLSAYLDAMLQMRRIAVGLGVAK